MVGAIVAVAWWGSFGCGRHASEVQPTLSNQERDRLESEYLLLQAELSAAMSDSVYLVLDFAQERILLKLRAAVVWTHPMTLAHGASQKERREFIARFTGESGTLIRRVEWKHLFAGTGKIPSSTLEVVAKTLGADPSKLQRIIPERFVLCLGNRTFVDVRTDVEGSSSGSLSTRGRHIARRLGILLGGASLDLAMEGEAGLSLYDAVFPGMRVLLVPPAT